MEDQFPNLQGVTLGQRYTLTSEIGRGGFGVVFKATQLNMNREVAIKILPPRFMAIPDVVERFKREAQLASRLRHPNTITVYDYGQQDNLLYIAMELLEGGDLADLLERHGRLPYDRIVHIATQVLKSLAEAHDVGIIHRDMKPENIFLNTIRGEEDFVKVLDFGIAKLAEAPSNPTPGHKKLTITGSTVGTPTYMSPEQTTAKGVDSRTDLYALGIILYELVMGAPPFVDDDPIRVMRAHLFDEPPPITREDVRGTPLERIIIKAIQKDKALRYATARDFLKDLRAGPLPLVPTGVPSSLLNSSPEELVLEEMGANPSHQVMNTSAFGTINTPEHIPFGKKVPVHTDSASTSSIFRVVEDGGEASNEVFLLTRPKRTGLTPDPSEVQPPPKQPAQAPHSLESEPATTQSDAWSWGATSNTDELAGLETGEYARPSSSSKRWVWIVGILLGCIGLCAALYFNIIPNSWVKTLINAAR